MDAIITPPRSPRFPVLGEEGPFEGLCASGAEVVPAAEDVASVCVSVGVEVGEEGEHFCCVAAAAEDDEDVGWCAAAAGR